MTLLPKKVMYITPGREQQDVEATVLNSNGDDVLDLIVHLPEGDSREHFCVKGDRPGQWYPLGE